MLRSGLVATVVVAAWLLVLLPLVLSVVPSLVTVAVFERTVPLATPAPTVTWIVNTWSAPAARPVVLVQVTSWPLAEQVELLPLSFIVRPASHLSLHSFPTRRSSDLPLWTVIV